MPKNNTTKEQSQAQQGQTVIAEAAQLLRQMRFSQNQGAYAEGQQVAVSVDPRWNDDNETIRVLITCYAFGHRRVDWAKLPVHVLPEGGGTGVYAIVRLDTRGQAMIPRLPPGQYRLALRVKPAQVEWVLAPQPQRLAAQGEDEASGRRVWRGEGADGPVVWILEETEEGDVQIAFETREESLAGCVVAFSLVDPASKRVHYSRQLTLAPAKTPGKWEGWYSVGTRTEVQGPYELVFEVLPPDEAQ
jgi:hypothetical protein